MSRTCSTCQHLKRPEIDRRLAAGEPLTGVARDYDLNVSSLHRHKSNCLKLASSNAIKKEAAQGTAAVALLPSKETLSGAYFELCQRIDQIATQAQQQGSLAVALSGLKAVRQTLDSLARLAGHVGRAEINVAVQNTVNVSISQISALLIEHFDKEPELKARIAQALIVIDGKQATQSATRGDPANSAAASDDRTVAPPALGKMASMAPSATTKVNHEPAA